jgi:hypothetical protein
MKQMGIGDCPSLDWPETKTIEEYEGSNMGNNQGKQCRQLHFQSFGGPIDTKFEL